jgi:DNA/RNA endonuclease G (NUC1)
MPAMSLLMKSYLVLCAITSAIAVRARETKPNKATGTDTEVSNSEHLLCGFGVEGSDERLAECSTKCVGAMQSIALPPFPLHFFGGLDSEDRDKNASLVADVIAEQMTDRVLVRDQKNFAVPMKMEAYFSCYTRSKWPLFNAWVVSPELQSDKKNPRHGSFGNVDKDKREYAAFHARFKDEFLRAHDVKGVWSDYYGFDQGHWAPDAPFRMVKNLVSSTYYYINVSPQSACLNRQEWEHLESSIRKWASPRPVGKGTPVSVMAGPLEHLPEYFVSTPAMIKKWTRILDQWRVASEVLMRGVETAHGMKDPHWVEATEHTAQPSIKPSRKKKKATESFHCMLRGDDAARKRDANVTFGVDRDELRDLAVVPSCMATDLVKKGLENFALYLMTQAGSKAVRRGVRVPLAYWKVASWEQEGTQVYCCYLMDQAGVVDMRDTGEICLDVIGKSYNVIPDGLTHAGEDTCGKLYTPRGGKEPENQQTQETDDCDFSTNGIGWRGEYLLKENGIDY